MTNKLIQKHLLRGVQEFEMDGDSIRVRIKAPFQKEEILSVVLTALNPEPVIDATHLHFTSRVNGEALISLRLAKPSAGAFNAFVNMVKQRAQEEYDVFTGFSASKRAAGLAANVYEEPTEFGGDDLGNAQQLTKTVDPDKLRGATEMLEQYLDANDIQPLLSALTALQAEPQSATRFMQMADEFNALGIQQGAVLTYAPYLSVLLYDDPLGS